ncbi:MAG TPA: M12 family metallo-peptidase, partial [Chitinophagaceae bacterium]|nr:M12 family metallo-peptidase [Chitinophagaceae bacterium]
MLKKIYTFFILMIVANAGWAQQNSLWSFEPNLEVQVPGQRQLFPNQYSLFSLNTFQFKSLQHLIPIDENSAAFIIDLPTPDGGLKQFRVFEAPMMEAPLAVKYPQIKTYTAIAIGNPLVTAKLDFTVFGFHGKVFDNENTYFIDPLTNMSDVWYQVYYKHDFIKPASQRMQCQINDEEYVNPNAEAVKLSSNDALPSNSSFKQNGADKRVYRLALACTVEYSAAVGGASPTKASVLSAMVTSMNRVNGVFERDFSMHANLVANNDTLIYIGTTDPYTNSDGNSMLSENQTTINARIGSANYDFGHVFSTGGGGVAIPNGICDASKKARGVTGSSNPVGDPFDIDYVAHEMGHQFGAQHTFNSVTGSCSGGNRSGQSAFEIGSATTIMGYAGICSTDDIQLHSDDYYHIRSLEQMTGSSVTACATLTASNNTLPTLDPIIDTFIIPDRTSFELTAKETDGNVDPLTYCWEEYDRGDSGQEWDAVTTVAPVFRSFLPATSPTRMFPTMKYLVQNLEMYKGEILPANARILHFRCTLRDLHNGYGAFYTSPDTVRLDVRTTTDLFRVTSQPTNGTTWPAYSTQTVTWDVAGTTAAPFLCTNVDIYMTSDSGKTWPFLLASNVPNNGTATVTAPNVTSNFCRVKVKGSGNVFFDLNDGWIKATSAPATIENVNKFTFSMHPNPATTICS